MTPQFAEGHQIGPYEIIRLAGSGGMGEVYEALDARLNRRVAIKILLPGHAWDSDGFRRFAQEARSTGGINHPNIVVVHSTGEHEGHPYIVTEFLEGNTLRERLEKGPLTLRESLRICGQVAYGLSAVHARGVIHRDLKPENIFLTRSGVTKILDFGLAKDLSPGAMNPAQTTPGQVVGTPAYMSPEQIQGLPLDARSDIFSLGSILFEMLTGRACFAGKGIVETFHAILRRGPPPLGAFGVQVPDAVQRLLSRCMALDPMDRFSSVSDLAFTIECLEIEDSEPEAPITEVLPAVRVETRPPDARVQRILAVIGLTVTLVLGFFGGRLGRQTARLPGLDVTLESPPRARLGPALALSRSGAKLLFEASNLERGQYLLWLRNLEVSAPAPLFGTEGGYFPFWAPSGEAFGFFSGGKLKILRLTQGLPETVAEARRGLGGSWNDKDKILFAPDFSTGLFVLDLSTRVTREATVLDPKAEQQSHSFPQFLPDQDHFLFFVQSLDPEVEGTYVTSLDGDTPRRILPARTRAVFAESPDSRNGALFWTEGSTLMAAPFNPSSRRLLGPSVVIESEILTIQRARYGSIAVSENGLLAFVTQPNASTKPVWLDRSGTVLQSFPPGLYRNLAASPASPSPVCERADPVTGERKIVLLSSDSVPETRIPSEPGAGISPVFSPDGRSLAFTWDRNGSRDIYLASLTAPGEPRLLLRSPPSKYPVSWSADGRHLLFETRDPKSLSDIWILENPMSEKPLARPLLAGTANEAQARFSPDGRFIVYSSDESGRWQVYARPFPGPGDPVALSQDGGTDPVWAPGGQELFFLDAERTLTSVEVDLKGGILSVSAPRPLFRLSLSDPLEERSHYTVSADGQRFLVNSPVDEGSSSSLRLVQGWERLLKKGLEP